MFKIIKQHDIKDCGAACLSMICTHYGLRLPLAKYRELIKVDNNGASIYGLVDGASRLGLEAEALMGSPDELLEGLFDGSVFVPFIARVIIDEVLEHYVVVYKLSKKHIYVADPAEQKKKYTYDDFLKIWTGHVVTFKPTEDFVPKNETKGTMSRFVKLIIKQKKLLALVFAVSLLISALGVAGSFIFQIIIDGLMSDHHDISFSGYTIGAVCLAVMGLYTLQALLSVLRGYFLSKMSRNVDLDLIPGFFNHMSSLPMKHLTSRKNGELLSRFDDAQAIKQAISGAALSLMLDTTMVLFCVLVLLSINKLLFLIALITVLCYAFVIFLFVNPIKNINEKIMQHNAECTSYLKESIDGIETVKAFGAERLVQAKNQGKFAKLVNYSMKGSVIYTLEEALSTLTASLGIIVLLWSGTHLVMNHVVSLGTLITFYSLLGYFLDPIQSLVNLQPMLQTAVVSAQRLCDILDLEQEKNDSSGTYLDGNIDIRDLSFRYGNRELVLQDVSMHIEKGATVALVGESGSGKTTLAKLIMAFYTAEKGSITIGGVDIFNVDQRVVRQGIAYVSQDVFMFSDTVKNNLRLSNENISDEEILKACHLCSADEFISRLPLGLNTMLGENGHDLSGGQKQRLAIARALLKKPSILILDEATSNLDTVTENSIRETIERIGSDITCIIIAHRLSTIKNCDKIFVMQNGRIAEQGSHEELMKINGVYKSFVDKNK